MAALADRLVGLDPEDRLMRSFLAAWSRPTAREREEALNELDLTPHLGTFAEALERLEPPMPRRFRERPDPEMLTARRAPR
jgi:hypothetical protein